MNLQQKKDDHRAFFNLGLLYEKGLGVNKDIKVAKDYFEKACLLGSDKGCTRYDLLNQ